jgi:REP element-mobilizing transposase RayT
VEWLPVFTHKKYFEIIIQSLKFCQNHKGLEIYAYVILDNHLHLVIFGPDVAQIIGSFKKFTARQIIKQLQEDNKKWLLTELAFYKKGYKTESTYQVWQEGSQPKLILSDEMLTQKIEYIHFNPVKKYL